jgi:hypothetical protein
MAIRIEGSSEMQSSKENPHVIKNHIEKMPKGQVRNVFSANLFDRDSCFQYAYLKSRLFGINTFLTGSLKLH